LIYKPVSKGMGRVPMLREELDRLAKEDAAPELIRRVTKELSDELAGLRAPAWNLNVDSDLRGANLLVIDEISQVSNSMATDLLSFGVPILVLGDPYQLPPIGDGGYFTEAQPDFLLTEIHRQARDSAVIRLATMARETGVLPPGTYEDPSGAHSIVTDTADPDQLLDVEQVIVGTNKVRHRVNGWVRRQRGLDGRGRLPVIGDRLVCLRNFAELGLMNGGLYESIGDAEEIDDRTCLVKIQSLDFPEQDSFSCVAHKALFHGDPEDVDPWRWDQAQGFDFSYALTAHKAQGSQYSRVAIRADWPGKETWRRWLYTAVSRAVISDYIVMG